MRSAVALVAVLFAAVGCAHSAGYDALYPRLRYHEVLSRADAPVDATEKLVPPTGSCLVRARARLYARGSLLSAPLDEPLRSGMLHLLQDLHPVAKQVLAQTHGVWLADHIPDAAAVYFPCAMEEQSGRGGFVLLDAEEYPLGSGLRDAEVPALYWRALAGSAVDDSAVVPLLAPARPERSSSSDDAMRYLVLHELGHALSLMAGEFDLSDAGRFQVGRTDGFFRFSWRLRRTTGHPALVRSGRAGARGVAPRVSLSLREWGSVLDALDAEPALPTAGSLLRVVPSAHAQARRVCAAAHKLTRAGFITPTAALYPTEDFAELFAHAILADEGKITRTDRIPIELPHCSIRDIRAPYFSPWIESKRDYLERRLGIGGDGG